MGMSGIWAHVFVPNGPGCPPTDLRGMVMADWLCSAPQSPPVIISNKTLFILQSSRIVGELALGLWAEGVGEGEGAS